MHSRGLDPESDAFFYLDELEAIIQEWVAVVYHYRPHDSLVDPHLPALRMSPAHPMSWRPPLTLLSGLELPDRICAAWRSPKFTGA